MCAKYLTFRISQFTLTGLLLVCCAAQAEIKDNHWNVQKGDTLYAIARAIFPAQVKQQARLRQDILRLNPAISQNNVIRLDIGMQLTLPDYVLATSTQSLQPGPPQKQAVVATAAGLSSNQWLVRSGETLYSISRKIYPGDVLRQGQLRRDIALLNPQVFQSGAQNMKVGSILLLPEYVVSQKEVPPVVATPVQEAPSLPPLAKPADVITVEPEPSLEADRIVPEPVQEVEAPVSKERTTVYVGKIVTESHFLFSVGYSIGGDLLAKTVGGHDITLGSGLHLRFDYESIARSGHGYRIGLGYQYDLVDGSGGDSATLQQTYLQALYLNRFTDFIFGAGIVYHDGTQFESDISGVVTTTKFDAAAGAVLLLEYVGAKNEYAFGLSYTAAEFETTVSALTFDAARTELYYSMRF